MLSERILSSFRWGPTPLHPLPAARGELALDGGVTLAVCATGAEVVAEPQHAFNLRTPCADHVQIHVGIRPFQQPIAHLGADAVKRLLDDADMTYEPNPELTDADQTAWLVNESAVTLALDAAQGVARGFAT